MVVGWSIDSTQTTTLVLNALGMATRRRVPAGELVIHSDRGVQFTSWAFSHNVRAAGLAPSMGAVGSPYDNAMVESFWARMQVKLFNRRAWKTRLELATAIHDHIELFHNTRRRHSSLDMLTPTEYEHLHHDHGRLTPEPRLQKPGADHSSPATLLSYSTPVTRDAATITYKLAIGATETLAFGRLRPRSYHVLRELGPAALEPVTAD
jgi:hypothetical protein